MNAFATWDHDDADHLAHHRACPHIDTVTDDNSELLAALMRRQELCFPQTWMTKTDEQKWTHFRPTGEQVQIDHTIARRAWRGAIDNISTDHTAGLNSNHRLVTTTLQVKRGAIKKQEGTPKYERKPKKD